MGITIVGAVVLVLVLAPALGCLSWEFNWGGKLYEWWHARQERRHREAWQRAAAVQFMQQQAESRLFSEQVRRADMERNARTCPTCGRPR
jgi:hypothetical protein